eukprot:GHRR01028930.1.p1 GENE.GHRR01028930.1~~GHRR01028930.1.p1  ORF type:complete len:206 (+),score=71.97 GHRR01028930.1:968-1585(+)
MLRPPPAPGSKVDFNALKAPSNYVPGLGRGATGFTTRSDIGPARAGPVGDSGEKEEGADDNKFDEFMGSDAGMFAGGQYDEDDKEADRVWESIDKFMDERRRERRERLLKEHLERMRADNPKITEQFADLKRSLAQVSTEEWEGIPDVGDRTVKKRPRFQGYAPAPDSLLSKAAAALQTDTTISAADGLVTPGTQTTADLTAIGR